MYNSKLVPISLARILSHGHLILAKEAAKYRFYSGKTCSKPNIRCSCTTEAGEKGYWGLTNSSTTVPVGGGPYLFI